MAGEALAEVQVRIIILLLGFEAEVLTMSITLGNLVGMGRQATKLSWK